MSDRTNDELAMNLRDMASNSTRPSEESAILEECATRIDELVAINNKLRATFNELYTRATTMMGEINAVQETIMEVSTEIG